MYKDNKSALFAAASLLTGLTIITLNAKKNSEIRLTDTKESIYERVKDIPFPKHTDWDAEPENKIMLSAPKVNNPKGFKYTARDIETIHQRIGGVQDSPLREIFQDYTIRTYRNYSNEIHDGSLFIEKDNTLLYALYSNGGSFRLVKKGDVSGFEHEAGADITGNGLSNFIVAEDLGGSSGTVIYHIFEDRESFTLIDSIPSSDSDVFQNIDDDPYPEIAQWKSFPIPPDTPGNVPLSDWGGAQIFLKFNGEKFAPVKVSSHPYLHSAGEKGFISRKGISATMAKLIYMGHAKAAHQILEDHWPDPPPSKLNFVKAFKKAIESHEGWNDIQAINDMKVWYSVRYLPESILEYNVDWGVLYRNVRK